MYMYMNKYMYLLISAQVGWSPIAIIVSAAWSLEGYIGCSGRKYGSDSRRLLIIVSYIQFPHQNKMVFYFYLTKDLQRYGERGEIVSGIICGYFLKRLWVWWKLDAYKICEIWESLWN